MYSGLYERRPDTPFIFTNGRERKYNMAEQSLKEKTAKGLFWGGFSNGIQQLLNLLFGIIITRMLDSTDYGMNWYAGYIYRRSQLYTRERIYGRSGQ